MPYSIEEFAKLDLTKRIKKEKSKEELEDEYWNALSDIIDMYPIGLPINSRIK
jgi:hypothetical protein